MKLIASVFLILTMTAITLAGCAAVQSGPSVPSSEPSASAASSLNAASYSIVSSQIIRSTKDEKEAIYDAAPYYDSEWTAGSLIQDEDALYFTEGAVFSDGESCICETEELGAKYAVVRTDLNGGNRLVLTEKTVSSGYWDIAVYE